MSESKDRRKRRLLLERKMDATVAKRPCGECTACCTVLAIREFEKPIGVTCVHASLKGCGIYETRPKSCQEYLCLWKLGLGTMEQRPDRLGLVISPTGPGTPGYPACTVHELWPDAFRDAAEFIRETATRQALLLVRDGRVRTILGPEPLMQKLAGDIEKIRVMNAEANEQEKGLSR